MNAPEKAIKAARPHLPHPNLRAALEAAAPHIIAQALREAAEVQDDWKFDIDNWLRDRADEIEGIKVYATDEEE